MYSFKIRSLVALTFAMGAGISTLANAGIVQFDLKGSSQPGLHFLNEPSVASGGTGGEIGQGIFFDDVSNLLTLNVGWGSSQGFTDLSSPATNSHIHGVTANPFLPGLTQTGGVVFDLTRSSNAASGGTFTNAPILLSAAQKAALLEGRYYINIHTQNNTGGELRGFLVAVPEPSSLLLMIAVGGTVLFSRKRSQ